MVESQARDAFKPHGVAAGTGQKANSCRFSVCVTTEAPGFIGD